MPSAIPIRFGQVRRAVFGAVPFSSTRALLYFYALKEQTGPHFGGNDENRNSKSETTYRQSARDRFDIRFSSLFRISVFGFRHLHSLR